MATQSGIIIAGVNEPYTIVRDLPVPKPGPKQVLVKSLVTGINPVEPFMHHTGMLISSWPAILGSEASGVVVEVGKSVSRLSVGDHVYGTIEAGNNRCSTFQEFFLMDEDLTIKKSGNLSTEAACTVGVCMETAALALVGGTEMPMPEPGAKAEARDEWVVVIGGSGNVGQFGIQLSRLCGYKVLATCSPSKDSIALAHGATATLNSRASEEEQLAQISSITGGKFARVFDTSTFGYALGIKALDTISTAEKKWFTSVDDWSEFNTPPSITVYRTSLGRMGKLDDPVGKVVSASIASWIPSFEQFVERGDLKALDYQLADGKGLEAVIKAIALFESGKVGGKKLVVRIQDE